MIDVEETNGGLRVVDAAKNEVEIELEEWVVKEKGPEINRELDSTLWVTTSKVRIPSAGAMIESSLLNSRQSIIAGESSDLGTGHHLFQISNHITVYLQCASPVKIEKKEYSRYLEFYFPENTQISLGFRGETKFPSSSIKIPPTPDGLAAALTIAGSSHKTETPDRSYPSRRSHPPLIKIENGANLNGSTSGLPRSEIRLLLPPTFDRLFPAASLSYYLGAEVITEQTSNPRLEAGSTTHEFTDGTNFSHEVANVLRRIFYLDCLVREAGPNGMGIREFDLLADYKIVPNLVYEKTMAERMLIYLSFPFESIAEHLPDWPLTFFVEPTINHVKTIPYLLDRLALIHPPTSIPVGREGLLTRSLETSCRSSGRTSSSLNDTVETKCPNTYNGTVRGWLADGVAIDAFKSHPKAMENYYSRPYLPSDPISVYVVLNDASMELENTIVKDIYNRRAKEVTLEVNVLKNLTCDELVALFDRNCDFLHFIGHCDTEGLRCINGNISTKYLTNNSVRTFFLNACGSYEEGHHLINSGCIAGAVTLGDIIDNQAVKVGASFARLIMNGYTFEQSLSYARGQAIVNRQYMIIGDGTHTLTQGESLLSVAIEATSTNDGTIDVQLKGAPVNFHGGVTRAVFDERPHLNGNHKTSNVDISTFETFLRTTNDLIIFNGEHYWPEEVLEELF